MATISMFIQKDDKKPTATQKKSTPTEIQTRHTLNSNQTLTKTCIRKMPCHSIPANNTHNSADLLSASQIILKQIARIADSLQHSYVEYCPLSDCT
jgi:hypothetical protein